MMMRVVGAVVGSQLTGSVTAEVVVVVMLLRLMMLVVLVVLGPAAVERGVRSSH